MFHLSSGWSETEHIWKHRPNTSSTCQASEINLWWLILSSCIIIIFFLLFVAFLTAVVKCLISAANEKPPPYRNLDLSDTSGANGLYFWESLSF